MLTRRDTAQWGKFVDFDGMEALAAQERVPEYLTVWVEDYPIDLIVDNIGARTTLVSFHAALGSNGRRPPMFTGRAISQDAGVNRVFVSDPGLLSSDDLGLAWFLGTSTLDLTSVLTQIVQLIHSASGGQHLVFFGMSGGGFAALNMSHEFPGSLAVPVNPQTRILDYAEVHWDRMARACLGARSTDEASQLLRSHPRADQREVYGNGFANTVIYVQNLRDGHVATQMVPWFEAIGWSHRATALMHDWGPGHVPPRSPELREMLSQLAEVDGHWERLAAGWRARPATREWIKRVSGR